MQFIEVDIDYGDSIIDFYNKCAEMLEIPENVEFKYDCTKIEISEDRYKAFNLKYPNPIGFGMLWLNYGPKVNSELTGKVVKIEDGFISINE